MTEDKKLARMKELVRILNEASKAYYTQNREIMSNYYKDDRIAPAFTLVIYYGKEEWTFPLCMADMYRDGPYKQFVDRGAMHLLDVRHMDDEKLDGYSDELKAFLGYLRCANAAQQREFVRDNAEMRPSSGSL